MLIQRPPFLLYKFNGDTALSRYQIDWRLATGSDKIISTRSIAMKQKLQDCMDITNWPRACGIVGE